MPSNQYQASLINVVDEFQDYVNNEVSLQQRTDENVLLDTRAINELLEELRSVGDSLTALIVSSR